MNAVFFDMDGTLIDSKADIAETVNHTRRDLGLPDLPMETILGNVGQGAKVLLRKSIPECPSKAPEELLELFMAHYAEHMIESVQLYPGVRRTLEELRDRGWLLGVNTAKPSFATHAILEKFGIKGLFGNAIVAGGDCAEMKPSALPLRECAARMRGHRLSSHDWMVGDNWTDVKCAENACVKSAFCSYGFGSLGDARCTVKINRIEELLRHLRDE